MLGIIAALPLLLITGSGALLGCYDELRALSAGPRVGHSGAPAELAQVVAALERGRPGVAVEVLYLPQRSDECLAARVRDPAQQRQVLFLHPQTQQLLGLRPAPDWLDTALLIHRGKILGWPGQLLACVAGVAVAPLWLFGRRLTPRGRGSRHARLGGLLGAALTLVALLGATLNLCLLLAAARAPAPPREPAPARFSLDALAQRARGLQPSPLFSVHLPRRPGDPVLFYFRDDTRLTLAPQDGAVVHRERRGDTVRGWLLRLHSGQILGWFGQKGVGLIGLCGVLLIATGVRASLRRSRRAR